VTGSQYLRAGTWEIKVKIDRESAIVEQRREPREHKILFIKYWNGRKSQGTVTIDVSRQGLSFYCPEPLRASEKIKVEMEKTRKVVAAVVKNSKQLVDGAWRVGVQIV
jgi:hypothetical protein